MLCGLQKAFLLTCTAASVSSSVTALSLWSPGQVLGKAFWAEDIGSGVWAAGELEDGRTQAVVLDPGGKGWSAE